LGAADHPKFLSPSAGEMAKVSPFARHSSETVRSNGSMNLRTMSKNSA
jgi:hypothetical protein